MKRRGLIRVTDNRKQAPKELVVVGIDGPVEDSVNHFDEVVRYHLEMDRLHGAAVDRMIEGFRNVIGDVLMSARQENMVSTMESTVTESVINRLLALDPTFIWKLCDHFQKDPYNDECE